MFYSGSLMSMLPGDFLYLLQQQQQQMNSSGNETLIDFSDFLEPEMTPACRRYDLVMNCVIIGLLCVFGTAGNLVSFAVFSKDRVKTSTSFLLQALAIVDSCFLMVVFPTYTISVLLTHYGVVVEEDDVKIYLIPIAYVLQTATIWLVVLIGWNRYIAVCQPFKAAKLCTVARAKKQLAIVLTLAIIYSFPKFIEIPTDLVENHTYSIIYNNIMYTIFMLTGPLLALIIINTQLIRALRKLRRKRAEIRNRQSTRQQQDNSVTLVLIVVVVVLIVCQTPALINHVFWSLLDESQRYCGGFQYYFKRASNVFVVINSAINFLIYLFLNRRFRRILFQSFCGCAPVPEAGNGADATVLPQQATVMAPLDRMTSINQNKPGEISVACDYTTSIVAEQEVNDSSDIKGKQPVETSKPNKLNAIVEATEIESSGTDKSTKTELGKITTAQNDCQSFGKGEADIKSDPPEPEGQKVETETNVDSDFQPVKTETILLKKSPLNNPESCSSLVSDGDFGEQDNESCALIK